MVCVAESVVVPLRQGGGGAGGGGGGGGVVSRGWGCAGGGEQEGCMRAAPWHVIEAAIVRLAGAVF